jgi:hypothetical protein
MTDLDWRLLAVLDEVDPVQAGYLLVVLSELKVAQHNNFVSERRWWEFHQDGKLPRMTEERFSGEPFVGEFPWKH